MYKKILLIAFTVFTVSFLTYGQTSIQRSKAEREVIKANEEFDKAIVLRDAAAYERILADDFVFTSFDGTVTNKAQEVAKVKSGDLKFESGKSDDIKIKIYGKTAVLTGRFTAKGNRNGKDFTFTERYTAVFVKRKGRWQMVAEHASEVVQK
jgi:ketosteroid isomerase-like protein